MEMQRAGVGEGERKMFIAMLMAMAMDEKNGVR